jgi:hypothetical protein
MGFDHNGPKGANFIDPTGTSPAVRWEDEEEVERWFEALRDAVKDLRGAGRDRARSRRKRVLSRAEAGRQIGESSERALRLVGVGEAGWRKRRSPHAPDPMPEQGSSGDDPPFSSSRPITSPGAAG